MQEEGNWPKGMKQDLGQKIDSEKREKGRTARGKRAWGDMLEEMGTEFSVGLTDLSNMQYKADPIVQPIP